MRAYEVHPFRDMTPSGLTVFPLLLHCRPPIGKGVSTMSWNIGQTNDTRLSKSRKSETGSVAAIETYVHEWLRELLVSFSDEPPPTARSLRSIRGIRL